MLKTPQVAGIREKLLLTDSWERVAERQRNLLQDARLDKNRVLALVEAYETFADRESRYDVSSLDVIPSM